ncbi:MAG: hypothetical protein EBQ96_04605 [Proteobacteria bacterium]|nr:hypothetical protein [Pseudomonadota bacterium]
MIHWLKTNRLKVASASAVTGDAFMGLAGTAGLFHLVKAAGIADIFLVIGGLIAVFGHGMLLLWGRGGRLEKRVPKSASTHPQFLRPLMPWRYPLDTALGVFVFSGLLYALAGVSMGSWPLTFTGICVSIASTVGWLLPQEERLFGLLGMQITATVYMTATMLTYLAAYQTQNVILLMAALFYTCCNVIFFTVRKENQSDHTQSAA